MQQQFLQPMPTGPVPIPRRHSPNRNSFINVSPSNVGSSSLGVGNRSSMHLQAAPQLRQQPTYLNVSPQQQPGLLRRKSLSPVPVRVVPAPAPVRRPSPAPVQIPVVTPQQAQVAYAPLDTTDDNDPKLPRRPYPNSYWATPTLLGSEYPSKGSPANTKKRLETLLDVGITDFIDLVQAGEGLPGEQYTRPLQRVANERGFDFAKMSGLVQPQAQQLVNGAPRVVGGGMDFATKPDRYTVRYVNFPIVDTTNPDQPTIQAIMNAMYFSHTQGRRAVVHCNGGYGRTGTIIGCWLVFGGYVHDTTEAVPNTVTYNSAGQLVPYVKVKRAGEYALEHLARKWRGVEKSRTGVTTPGNWMQMEFVKGFRPPQNAKQTRRAR